MGATDSVLEDIPELHPFCNILTEEGGHIFLYLALVQARYVFFAIYLSHVTEHEPEYLTIPPHRIEKGKAMRKCSVTMPDLHPGCGPGDSKNRRILSAERCLNCKYGGLNVHTAHYLVQELRALYAILGCR